MRPRPALVLLALLGSAIPLAAQRSALREVRTGPSGSSAAGLSLVVGQPLGAFRYSADAAAGASAFGVISSPLGLRIEGAYLLYGHDYYGGGVSTDYAIATLGAGPQLTLGRGALRLYGFATIGGSLFWTSTRYEDSCGCYGSQGLYDDASLTGATQVGGGLLLGLRSRGTPVAIDLGVRDLRNGRVRYVPAGGVIQNSDGSFTVTHVESDVRLRVLQIGVTIGIR